MVAIIVSIVSIAVYVVAFGIPTYYMLVDKGYKKYHWVGYVFGLLGMIWCAGLPDLKTRQLVKDIKNQLEENNQQ